MAACDVVRGRGCKRGEWPVYDEERSPRDSFLQAALDAAAP